MLMAIHFVRTFSVGGIRRYIQMFTQGPLFNFTLS